MKLAVFAEREAFGRLEPLLRGLGRRTVFYRSYDDLLRGLPDCSCNGVLVACAGAAGMESVRAVRILLPSVPLIWLSNDPAFAAESYRAGCHYFSADAITPTLLRDALTKCNL